MQCLSIIFAFGGNIHYVRIYTRIYASAPIFINENAMSEAKRIVPPLSLLRRTFHTSHLGAKRGCLISLCVRCGTRRFGKKSKQSHYRSKRHLLSQRLSPRQSGDGLRSNAKTVCHRSRRWGSPRYCLISWGVGGNCAIYEVF